MRERAKLVQCGRIAHDLDLFLHPENFFKKSIAFFEKCGIIDMF